MLSNLRTTALDKKMLDWFGLWLVLDGLSDSKGASINYVDRIWMIFDTPSPLCCHSNLKIPPKLMWLAFNFQLDFPKKISFYGTLLIQL